MSYKFGHAFIHYWANCFICLNRFWHKSPILNARNDWPKQKSVIDDKKSIVNGCVVNIKCGQSNCKFQLTAYQYHYDPEDFNPVAAHSISTIYTDEQDEQSPSGSVNCLKPNNAAYLQVIHWFVSYYLYYIHFTFTG